MRGIISIFNGEYHVEGLTDGYNNILKHPGKSHDQILAATCRSLITEGWSINSEYHEKNEFGDPITLLYISK